MLRPEARHPLDLALRSKKAPRGESHGELDITDRSRALLRPGTGIGRRALTPGWAFFAVFERWIGVFVLLAVAPGAATAQTQTRKAQRHDEPPYGHAFLHDQGRVPTGNAPCPTEALSLQPTELE